MPSGCPRVPFLQLHKEKDFVVEPFEAQGRSISKSILKGWDTKTGMPTPGYREMPREALDEFIAELYKRKLVKPG